MKMKKLLIHIVIIAGLFFVIDRTAGLILKQLYSQSNATDEYKIGYANAETTDDLLFMGSSRCLHHFVPSVFEEAYGMTCFNAADWGIKNIYYHYGLLGNILSRYTPKVIVFEIHPCDYLDTPYSGTERAGSLAPFCGMSDECDEMLKISGNYWPYKLSMVYRYTGSLPALLFGRWGGMDRNLKGWKPLDGQLDTTDLKAEEFPFPVHQEKLQLLERFIQDCQAKGIRLGFIVSPMYICTEQDVYKVPRDLTNRYNIPFFDYFRDPQFMGHAELFYDYGHLNREGATIFSKKVCNDLKDYIKLKD
jgi:hypothetical protein